MCIHELSNRNFFGKEDAKCLPPSVRHPKVRYCEDCKERQVVLGGQTANLFFLDMLDGKSEITYKKDRYFVIHQSDRTLKEFGRIKKIDDDELILFFIRDEEGRRVFKTLNEIKKIDDVKRSFLLNGIVSSLAVQNDPYIACQLVANHRSGIFYQSHCFNEIQGRFLSMYGGFNMNSMVENLGVFLKNLSDITYMQMLFQDIASFYANVQSNYVRRWYFDCECGESHFIKSKWVEQITCHKCGMVHNWQDFDKVKYFRMIFDDEENLKREFCNYISQSEWQNFQIVEYRFYHHQKSASEQRKNKAGRPARSK